MIRRTLFKLLCLGVGVWLSSAAAAPTAYFADGYHGGVYGHYPEWVTQFMLGHLERTPDWRVNLEIEPETWDWAATNTLAAYQAFKAFLAAPTNQGRVEFVNPAYAQSYLWNTPGESIVRQFEFGIRKLQEHFPEARFTTYSTEEPCFTSALPGVLASFGFQHAVLKSPNTCWGGYMRGFGGELITWTGPDGTRLLTVPRYEIEKLAAHSTWQTTAPDNAPDYIQAALAAGIRNPVGMCLQDAGWRKGPWLGNGRSAYAPSRYVAWTEYFNRFADRARAPEWRVSQEDVQVSLVWGAQILQTLAQQVRKSENRILVAEKLAAMATLKSGVAWPASDFNAAWRTLLLAEHHDCWITPYNGRRTNWAQKVELWTRAADAKCDEIVDRATRALTDASAADSTEPNRIRVFNPTSRIRRDLVTVPLPKDWASARVLGADRSPVPSQVASASQNGDKALLVLAEVPAMGYCTYELERLNNAAPASTPPATNASGLVVLNSGALRLAMDPQHGGVLRQLVSPQIGEVNLVATNGARSFLELRGFFHREGVFHSSADQPATVTLVENGPVRWRAQIAGRIDRHPFVQTLTLVQGEPRIDVNLRIDWDGNPGIGAAHGQTNRWNPAEDPKAFYDDRAKLLALFPLNSTSNRIVKDAPFDVTESKLTDTFFTRWSEIKNNILLNWVDAEDRARGFGLALLSDHTTSYAHGAEHPLALTVQYSGLGLWGRDYRIAGPTELNYALVPHRGDWSEAELPRRSQEWREPLTAVVYRSASAALPESSLVRCDAPTWELTTIQVQTNAALVRFFNASARAHTGKIVFARPAQKAEWVEFDGRVRKSLPIKHPAAAQAECELELPAFGVATIRFVL